MTWHVFSSNSLASSLAPIPLCTYWLMLYIQHIPNYGAPKNILTSLGIRHDCSRNFVRIWRAIMSSHLVTHRLTRCNLCMSCPTWALDFDFHKKKEREMTLVVRCEDGPLSSSFQFFVRNVTLHILHELLATKELQSLQTNFRVRPLRV